MRRNDVALTSFRRRVPTRFLINQCQIITFLILKYDIIENSRIELRGIVLPVQVGGLLGGQGYVAPPPPLRLFGGPGPPLPPPLLRLWWLFEHCRYLLSSVSVLNAHKHENTNINQLFAGSYKPRMLFFLLINVKMPTIVGLLTFMSRKISCSADLPRGQISQSTMLYQRM